MGSTWQASELQTLDRCVVCGSARLTPLYTDLRAHDPGEWRLDRCEGCSTGLLNPRPTFESIGKAYLGEYAPYVPARPRPEPHGALRRLHREITDAYLARRWGYGGLVAWPGLAAVAKLLPGLRRAADRLVRFVPAPADGEGRLLDVGCAAGTYMQLMRDLGWDTAGIELDAATVETSRRLGLAVRQGAMADLDPAIDGTFDRITVGHVIEHTHDPIAALRAAHSVLNPGGVMWIGTPNLRSLGARVFRSRWRALEPPRHLVLFTPSSLAAALHTAGFTGVRVVRATASAPWHVERSAELAGIRRRWLLRPAARAVNAISYLRPTLSDELTVIAARA